MVIFQIDFVGAGRQICSLVSTISRKPINFAVKHPVDSALGVTAAIAPFAGPGELAASLAYAGLRIGWQMFRTKRLNWGGFFAAPIIFSTQTIYLQQHDWFSTSLRTSAVREATDAALQTAVKNDIADISFIYLTNGNWSWQKTIPHKGIVHLTVLKREGECFKAEIKIEDPYYFSKPKTDYYDQSFAQSYCAELVRPNGYEQAIALPVPRQ